MKKHILSLIVLSCLIACQSKKEEKNNNTHSEPETTTVITPIKKTKTAGIIVPVVDSLLSSKTYCCVVTPESGFTVYDKPNGKAIGTVKREISEEDDQSPYKLYFISGTIKTKIDSEEYKEINYDIYAINYSDTAEGYVRVFDNRKNYWLKVAEINQKGFKTVGWTEHLLKERHNVLGYYANEPGLKLRKEPNSNSDVIRNIRGDLFEIKLTEKISGQWCKVIITQYQEHPCETELKEQENKVDTTEGWLKIIDDNGEPNIWHYTKGC